MASVGVAAVTTVAAGLVAPLAAARKERRLSGAAARGGSMEISQDSLRQAMGLALSHSLSPFPIFPPPSLPFFFGQVQTM